MNIELNVLDRQYNMYKNDYDKAVLEVLESGYYIMGPRLECFESHYSKYLNIKYCVGLNSGLDALVLAIRALDLSEGDEIIVPANTYIATVLGITENGAKPVFVEPNEYYNIDPNKIEAYITEKTKAILVVHLYGQTCEMDKIIEISKKHHLYLLEDCAQSHGAKYKGKMTGTFGDIGCFSFYPTKNLGAFGDAGAIVTNNIDLYNKIKMLRNYGSNKKYYFEYEGINSRLDEVQAALLDIKLSHLDELTSDRKKIANRYLDEIKNDNIILPLVQVNCEHVWHLFVIRTKERNKFQQYLLDNGIKTQIHYPIPPHLSKCYEGLDYKKGDFPITEKYSNDIISLPLYNFMTDDEISYVVEIVNKYKG